ncbi:hypothetical protein M8C21_021939, partial [Ambrosia artemisiifolia]
QSIDLYSSVPSPSLNFLGTPTLSRLGSSFLSSSLTRRHTPEILPILSKPLLPDNQQPQERRSSHSLLPPRGSSAKKLPPYQKSSKVSHELPLARKSSYGQSVINADPCFCAKGLTNHQVAISSQNAVFKRIWCNKLNPATPAQQGILSTPYAVKEGGWVGLLLLFLFGVLSFYTGILLRYCLDSQPGLETYPDIGQAAFGTTGRLVISACCVEYIILESDNLSSLFPNAHVNLGGLILNAHYLFAIIITLAVLPTVWLRDMSVLSYISAGGVVASVLAAGCLFWVGLVDNVGFQIETTKALNLSSFPVAIGLYGYCYSGHAVFPNIYTSMAKRSQYPMVLLTSFCICGILYAAVAVMGYMILEELIPSNHMKSHLYSITIRTGLVLSTLVVALCIPFFGLVMSLIGSLLTMLVHPKGKDNSFSGIDVCLDHRDWNHLLRYWNLYIAIGNHSTVVMIMF